METLTPESAVDRSACPDPDYCQHGNLRAGPLRGCEECDGQVAPYVPVLTGEVRNACRVCREPLAKGELVMYGNTHPGCAGWED